MNHYSLRGLLGLLLIGIPLMGLAADGPVTNSNAPDINLQEPVIFERLNDYQNLTFSQPGDDLTLPDNAPQVRDIPVMGMQDGAGSKNAIFSTEICADYTFGANSGNITSIGDVGIVPFITDYYYAYANQPTTFTFSEPASSFSMTFYYGGVLVAYDAAGNYLTQATVTDTYWGTPATVSAPAGTKISSVVAQSIFGANSFFYSTGIQVCVASNTDPVAVAGEDQSFECVAGTQTVQLDGTGSFDADGDLLTYSWTGTFGSAQGATPTLSLGGGTHVITLSVDDGNGGVATDELIVDVDLDVEPPVLTLLGDAQLTLECPATYSDPGVTVSDCNTYTLSTSGSVGSDLGTYTLSYTAVDLAGNTSTISREIQVVDTQAPSLTLSGENPLELPLYSTFVEPGYSLSDACDPAPQLTISGSVDLNTPGSYELVYTATDASGNMAAETRIVQVYNSAPTVQTALSDIEFFIGGGELTASLDLEDVFSDPDTNDVLVYDYSSSNADAVASVLTGSLFELEALEQGTSIFLITATDNWGASTNQVLTVTVSIAPVLANAVLFAEEEIKIQKDVEILSGNVIVNQAHEHTSSGNDDDDDDGDDDDGDHDDDDDSGHYHHELKVDKDVYMASGYAMKSNSIEIKRDAVIESDVHANDLDNEGDIFGDIYTELVTPQIDQMPDFFEAEPGTEDIYVRKNGSLTLPPGDYDRIKLKDRATLTLTGGVYNIGKLETGKYSHVRFEESSEVRVHEKIKIGKRAYVGPAGGSTIDASNIIFYVTGAHGSHGNDDDDDDDDGNHGSPYYHGHVVKLEESVEFYGTIYAPYGSVDVKKENDFTGAILARKIDIDKSSILNQDGYFSNEDDGDVVQRPIAGLWIEPEMEPEIPEATKLAANFPNPFNPSTTISYALHSDGPVSLKIYDLRGSEVAVLAQGHQPAGEYAVQFAANGLSSGTYLYVLETNGFREVKRMILLK